MSPVGEREIRTQRRVAAFFRDALGYAHLGDRRDRASALRADVFRRRRSPV